MISSKFKLKQGDFPRDARLVRFPSFTIRVQKNGFSYNRYGVVVSAKAVPSAVRRHFWKRRFYDMVKSWKSAGLDVLISAGSGIDSLDPDVLTNELERAQKELSRLIP